MKSWMTKECIFCGQETHDYNKEHVIPDWLQKRFNLQHKSYILPNGTKYAYHNVKVPACRDHNSLFGSIESRIGNGIYDPLEVYLWALKIHIGLKIIDSNLIDYNDAEYRKVMDSDCFESDLRFFRTIFSAWKNKALIWPGLIGSVFVLDSNYSNFHMVDSFYGLIAIWIGKKLICVMFKDLESAFNSNALENWNRYVSSREINCFEYELSWVVELIYYSYRYSVDVSYLATKNSLEFYPVFSEPKKDDEELYDSIRKRYGFYRNSENEFQFRGLMP